MFTLYSRKCQKKQKTILLVEYFGSGRRNKEEKCGKAQNFLARFCPGPTLDFLPLYPFDNDIDDNADENRETMKVDRLFEGLMLSAFFEGLSIVPPAAGGVQ